MPDDLKSRIAALSPEHLGKLQQRLNRESLARARGREIPRREGQGPCRLSFAQERLWFLHQFEPAASAVYNIGRAFRLQGPLHRGALQKSLQQVGERHEALSTVFRKIDDVPMQFPRIAPPPPLEFTDLSDQQASGRDRQIQRLLEAACRRPFDLSQDSLLRAHLLGVGEEEHILLLMLHHIACDGWSLDVLLREMSTLYEAFSLGRAASLPRLPIQYADYAEWQRDGLQGEVLEHQAAYWRSRLAGAPPVLQLPLDRPRPNLQTHAGARAFLTIPESLTASLKAFSRREKSTLFMTLLAAFQVLLYRYSGQSDVLIGTPMADRTRSETEGLIGLFVNTLVMRTVMDDNPAFLELLRRVRDVAAGAYAHQDLPFEKLVDILQPERSLAYSPLFQEMFILNSAPGNLRLSGLEVTEIPVHSGTSKFDLTLSLDDLGGEIRGALEYNTDLFDAETLQRMLRHYLALLEAVVEDPTRKVSALPLLQADERQKILVEWNNTAADFPREACLQDLFEAQVARTPDHVAVVYEDRQLTYLDLNQRANQLAHYLRQRGVGRETLVGICLERSLDWVVAILGVLKSGGAYVPLDPAYPQERLVFMLEDTQAPVVLSQSEAAAQLTGYGAAVICLDSAWAAISAEPATDPPSLTTPDNLAYVIYTSGSSGRPKGVMGIHRGAVNRFFWMWRAYPFSRQEVCCCRSSFNFVDSIWELFGPLLRGVRVHLLPQKSSGDALAIVEYMVRFSVSRLVLVPSLLQAILSLGESTLRRIHHSVLWTCSGEALPAELVHQLMNALPGAHLLNIYGSTEVSADACCFEAREYKSAEGGTVPIGRPIANTQLYILDACMRPVPLGVTGELYVGGEGLARGYLHRPELSADRFVRHPFASQAGERLYRAGDLARYRPDGNIEYLGRMDQQVKIRGFRIELGEIEANLAQHPKVRECVVVAREDVPADKRLVAYIVPLENALPSVSELRRHLQNRLPEFMLPSHFVHLPALPLTPNGKVNRRALPPPCHDRPELEEGYVAPRTPVEKAIAQIWAEVLGLARVGICDNFFELGGHSLLAIRIIGKINRLLNVCLTVPAFFLNPTIQGIALAIVQRETTQPVPILIPLQLAQSEGTVFFLEPTLGMCRLAELVDSGSASFAATVPMASAVLEAALANRVADLPSMEALAAPYTALIASQKLAGPCALVGYSFRGILAFEVAHQLQRQGREVTMLVLLDSLGPLRWWYRLKKLNFARARWAVNWRLQHIRKVVASRMQAPSSVSHPNFSLDALAGVPGRVYQPVADVPWEILGKVNRHALNSYRFRPLKARGFLIRAQGVPRYEHFADMGWEGLFTGGLEIAGVPGDHTSLLDDPHIVHAAHALQNCLAAHLPQAH